MGKHMLGFLIAYVGIIAQFGCFVKPFLLFLFYLQNKSKPQPDQVFFAILVKFGSTQYAFSGHAAHLGLRAVQVSRPNSTI